MGSAFTQNVLGMLRSAAAGLGASLIRFQGGANTVQDLREPTGSGLVGFGTVGLDKGVAGGGQHLNARPRSADMPARLYQMPNGHPVGNVRSAFKIFLDDYETDSANYRDVGLYHDLDLGHNGSGMFLINSKVAGDFFGCFQDVGLSFSEGVQIPLRGIYLNTALSEANLATVKANFIGNWRQGMAVAAGDIVCASTGKLYQAASTGVTGAVKPSHAAGTVSDGSVDWTFFHDHASGGGAGFRAFVVLGRKDDPLFYSDSSVKEAGCHLTRDAVVYNDKRLIFIDAAGNPTWRIYSPAGTDDLRIESADGLMQMRFDKTGKFIQSNGMSYLITGTPKSTSSGATTNIDVTGTELFIFNNAAPTMVTSLSGSPYQRVTIRSGNGNTTLVHGASIKTNTGLSKVLSANSCLVFQADALGTTFFEQGTV